jgi:broad specificity phosphatase PhoE
MLPRTLIGHLSKSIRSFSTRCKKPTNLFLVRHGARHDLLTPEWKDEAMAHGVEYRDPPLSALGHQQARDTAAYFMEQIPDSQKPKRILTSPFLRVIQTATPTADALGLKLEIEEGLAETHFIPRRLATPVQRFAYFPQIAHTVESRYRPETDEIDRHTNMPAESYPKGYLARMLDFAPVLVEHVDGDNVACFSHAASVALVAALLEVDLKEAGRFAPCGVFHLQSPGEGKPWELIQHGESNPHVSENHPSTYPWCHDDRAVGIWRDLLEVKKK